MLHQWLLGPLRIGGGPPLPIRFRGGWTSLAARGKVAVCGVGLWPRWAPGVPWLQ